MQHLQQSTLAAALNGWLEAVAAKRQAVQQAQELAAVAVHRMQSQLVSQAFAVRAVHRLTSPAAAALTNVRCDVILQSLTCAWSFGILPTQVVHCRFTHDLLSLASLLQAAEKCSLGSYFKSSKPSWPDCKVGCCKCRNHGGPCMTPHHTSYSYL